MVLSALLCLIPTAGEVKVPPWALLRLCSVEHLPLGAWLKHDLSLQRNQGILAPGMSFYRVLSALLKSAKKNGNFTLPL